MAIDAEAIDRVLDMRLLPVAKVPKAPGGKCRAGTLGPHEFTTRAGQPETLDVRVFNGTMWVRFPSTERPTLPYLYKRTCIGARKEKPAVSFMRRSRCRSAPSSRPSAGSDRQGALQQHPAEIHNDPHTRRTRMLRPIPEASNEFDVFGVREDIEAMFGNLKYKLRGRLPSIHEDTNRHRILSFMILGLSLAESAYEKRIAKQGHKPLRKTAAASRSHKPRRKTAAASRSHKPGSRSGEPRRRSRPPHRKRSR